ncbi:MAG: DUF2155 domain-containing protein [Phenylobacterium sp.]|nr:DUF2155 domain-containing protein [Phenylobacterium sp.]
MRPGGPSRMPLFPQRRVLVLVTLTAVAVLAWAEFAPAQQAPSSSDARAAAEPPAIIEEAPPAVVEAPPPAVAPPVPPSGVAPAAPPERRVAERPSESLKQRERFDVAVLQAVDKVTAETIRFEAPVGQPVRYKTLVLTVRACERTAADEPTEDSIAYLVVDSQPRAQTGRPAPGVRQVFRGWIYASSPGLNGPEHPVYDAWLITCRTSAPLRAAGGPNTPSTARAPASRSR